MIRRIGGPLGLLGRILAILLLTVIIEFGASTFLYERASRFSVREDEARRLAEHLVIARKLMDETPRRERPEIAHQLTTDRYLVRWLPEMPASAPFAPILDQTRRQILAWEPSLATAEIRTRLSSPGRDAEVLGELRLKDGSWMLFGTHELVQSWDLALGRMALALVPSIALLVVGSLLIRRALVPIRLLARATEQIGSGERIMVEEEGTTEVRQLIRAFNAMQHRIHSLIESRTQALAAVGHDMRTPLARLSLRAGGIGEDEVREAVERDVAEMDAMVASLLAFLSGDSDPEQPTKTDIAILAATVIDEASDLGADALYKGPDHAEAVIRKLGFRRALVNLVENALHYGTRVTLTLEPLPAGIRLLIEDDGPGIPEERLSEVLKPFARLDEARARNTKGLGLGLSIVHRAVKREHGRLTLSNRPEGGLRVEIVLDGSSPS